MNQAADRLGRGRAPSSRRSLPKALLAAFLVLVAGRVVVVAGDPDLAKFLLKGGKDDLGRKQYDQALTKFERAEREDPDLLETIYCQGLALDRRGDSRGAVQTYRRFLGRVDAKAKTAAPSKEEAALAKKAQERIDVLAAGTAERRRLDDGFVDTLMVFARAHLSKDPAIAGEALGHVLHLRPQHEEAMRLFAQTPAGAARPAARAKPPEGEEGEKPAAEGPLPAGFAAVASWKDLLEGKYFGDHDEWRYETDRLVIDREDGMLTRSPTGARTGSRFAVEIECRVVEARGRDPFVGVAFGFRDGDLYGLYLTDEEIVLNRVQGGERVDVARVDLAPPGTGGWHRVGAIVRGNKIEVWLDGKKRADHDATQRVNLSGEIGLLHQECKAEIRVLRLGEVPR